MAIGLFKTGANESLIADKFKDDPGLPTVHRTTIKKWIDKFKNDGEVLRKSPTGRPCKFTKSEQQHIVLTAKENDLSLCRRLSKKLD